MRAWVMLSFAAACSVAPLPAQAQASTYRDGSGRTWTASPNRNGVVLRSRTGTIYLGRDCDAASPRLGRGRWEWANGGFLVRFRGATIGFPRQEIDAGNGLNCRS